MKRAVTAAFVAASLSAPALATGGLLCKPVSGAGPQLSLVIGYGDAPGIVCANLKEAGRWHSTCGPNDPLIMVRRWLDRERVWVDIIDREGRDQAKLRALVQPKRRIHTALGTLTRRGKTYKVRCEEG